MLDVWFYRRNVKRMTKDYSKLWGDSIYADHKIEGQYEAPNVPPLSPEIYNINYYHPLPALEQILQEQAPLPVMI